MELRNLTRFAETLNFFTLCLIIKSPVMGSDDYAVAIAGTPLGV